MVTESSRSRLSSVGFSHEPGAAREGGVLLLFPPLCEAVQFPYGSLPMIHGALKAKGIPCRQADLNIGLIHAVLERDQLQLLEKQFQQLRERNVVACQYRLALIDFLIANIDELRRAAFETKQSDIGIDRTLQLLRNGAELFFERSALVRYCNSIPDLCADLDRQPDSDDIGSLTLRNLLHDLLYRDRPLVVGLSIAFFSQLRPALMISAWVKALCPDTLIIIGGPQVLLRGPELASHLTGSGLVDGIGTGAGEICLELIYHFARGRLDRRAVPDVLWVDNGEIGPRSTHALDSLPAPDYSGLPLRSYLSDVQQVGIITCVGCYWGRCSFCSYGQRHRRANTYREFSPAAIARICAAIVCQTGITRINFVDENTNLKLVVRAMRALVASGVTTTFSTRNRMERLLTRPEFCRELASLGCIMMSTGYETNAQRLLDAIHKGVKAAWYPAIIDNLYDAGIELRFSVMGGLPGETPQELEGSITFLRSVERKIAIDVMQMLVVEPQTALESTPEAFGLTVNRRLLRGNDLMSYRRGRVGHAFEYIEGPDVDEREHQFGRLFCKVRPRKIDRHKRLPETSKLAPNLASASLYLHPWVRLLPEGSGHVVADLALEQFVRLPPAIAVGPHGELSAAGPHALLLVKLANMNMGKLVPGVGV